MVAVGDAAYVDDVAPVIVFALLHNGAVPPAIVYHWYVYGSVPPDGLDVSVDVWPLSIVVGLAVGAAAERTALTVKMKLPEPRELAVEPVEYVIMVFQVNTLPFVGELTVNVLVDGDAETPESVLNALLPVALKN